MPRLDLRIEIRIGPAAFRVEVHHLFERLEAPVVHVRSGQRDLAQRGRLEIAASRAEVGQPALSPGDSRIVEALSVKLGPMWQAQQLPLPRNTSNPAFSSALNASACPAA